MSVHEKMNYETKQAIKKALLTQIEEVGFQRVTVKNLALTAKINRGTFYLHYADKFEVMEDLQQELLNALQSYIEKVQPVEAFHTLQTGQLYHPFIVVIQFIKEHAKAFRIILSEQGSPTFSKKMKDVFSNHILKNLTLSQTEVLDPIFEKYLQAFITSAILGVIQEWLEGEDADLSVEEMATIHLRIVRFISNLSDL
ncbi:TetR family transcriptional regulator [Lysinibacillus contaminans]|uniref:TetR family transcriptional regulator n=1 Tax=Lysinibacillus contaminans TaxID=1293441 RepID=A0ABR5K2Q8_9BACI|nr:TetR/AcrR family transcriptional regulator C-terminal domain-containing protein [Lysinibacillus contaminans]KOS69227.1 TetR family transcriptional regulator [Lysinibacillus contaminans]